MRLPELNELVKRAVWSIGTHSPGHKRDLCLFSTRRGGSTWLMETITSGDLVRRIDQPLSVHSASRRHRASIPDPELGQFIHLDQEDLGRVERFLESTLSGTMTVNAEWDVRKQTFHRRTTRTLLKVVDAKTLAAWMVDRFDLDVLVSIRHPIPTSLSIMRNGWDVTAPAYLHNAWFRDEYLSKADERLASSILRKGSLLEQHALGWTLENLALLRELERREDWSFVTYEESVLSPDEVVHALAARFDLPNVSAMARQIRVPSRSSRGNVSTIGRVQGPPRLNSWRSEVSIQNERSVMRIVESFGVTVYTTGHSLPSADAFVDQRLLPPQQ